MAAYLVGIPVNPKIYTSIKPCDTPKQTGCICSWRTYKEGYTPPFIENEKFDVIVSNPPYIAQDDIHLKQGDLRFEPISALASGVDGLDDKDQA